MRIETVIYVEPVAKARARTVKTKGGKIISFTPRKSAHAEALIREHVMSLGKFEAGIPLRLEATFYRDRPKSLPKRVKLPMSRPDIDNYTKLLTDALEKFVYANDSQITTALIKKRFGAPPRIELVLEEEVWE
jgi:Holliday junction resolvase RusA-like endonuclease